MSVKVGDLEILERADLDGMIENARKHVRDAGLPEIAVQRIDRLGFGCADHGIDPTVAFYREGLLFIACRTCERSIVVICVADGVKVLPAIEPSSWN